MTPERRAERMEPRRASPGRTVAVMAVFAATFVAATVSWVQVVTRLRNVIPLETRGTPAAIVWSDRVFRSEAEFARWLRGRGISYERWVKTHPQAVAILRKRDRAAAAPARPAARAKPAPRVAATTTSRAAEPAAQELSRGMTVIAVTALVTMALAFVVLLGAVARITPLSRLAIVDAVTGVLERYRFILLASTVSIGLGVLVGTLAF
jgi:hypothetical protein